MARGIFFRRSPKLLHMALSPRAAAAAAAPPGPGPGTEQLCWGRTQPCQLPRDGLRGSLSPPAGLILPLEARKQLQESREGFGEVLGSCSGRVKPVDTAGLGTEGFIHRSPCSRSFRAACPAQVTPGKQSRVQGPALRPRDGQAALPSAQTPPEPARDRHAVICSVPPSS